MSDLERHELLWTKAVDGLLSPAEQTEWQAWLAAHPEDAAEFAEDLAIKATTDAMAARIRTSAQLSPPRPEGGEQALSTAAFAALGIGTLGLLGFAGWTVLTAPDLPLWVRAGIGLAGVGAAVLFALTARRRFSAPDPYREIDR